MSFISIERYFEQLENLLPAAGPVKQVLIQLMKDCLRNVLSQRPNIYVDLLQSIHFNLY